jgi:Flagellar protein FliT
MTDPAEALLELAWAERRSAAEGRIDELPALHAERDRLLAVLPLRPEPHQVTTLQRVLAVQREVADLLRAARDAVATELARVDQGRATLRGYAAAGADDAPSFDTAA